MRYKVELTQRIIEVARVYVDAASGEEAEREALRLAAQVDYTGWRLLASLAPEVERIDEA